MSAEGHSALYSSRSVGSPWTGDLHCEMTSRELTGSQVLRACARAVKVEPHSRQRKAANGSQRGTNTVEYTPMKDVTAVQLARWRTDVSEEDVGSFFRAE
jgi:hypothetical protein